MSLLLFMDESGHDHKTMPYEVRGGFAVHARNLWRLVTELIAHETHCFGAPLHSFGAEIKGAKLLRKKTFKLAGQDDPFDEARRQELTRQFLARTQAGHDPTRSGLTAYGQACIEMGRRTFTALENTDAKILAAAIPRGSSDRRLKSTAPDYLRKDQIYLLERYFYLLEESDETGVIVMDESDKTADRSFIRRLHSYFTRTSRGQKWLTRIVPSPLFVASEMTYPVQAADMVIYALNWGFRLPRYGMNGTRRNEISEEFGWRLERQQYKCEQQINGQIRRLYGIVYVEDPHG